MTAGRTNHTQFAAPMSNIAKAVEEPSDIELLRQAADALANCYDVSDYPANGRSRQDAVLKLLKARLERPINDNSTIRRYQTALQRIASVHPMNTSSVSWIVGIASEALGEK